MEDMISRNTKRLKEWYWVLSAIWIVFWVLDILVLVPYYPDEGIMVNIKNIINDRQDLVFCGFLIGAPFYIYLLILLINKIFSKLNQHILKHTQF